MTELLPAQGTSQPSPGLFARTTFPCRVENFSDKHHFDCLNSLNPFTGPREPERGCSFHFAIDRTWTVHPSGLHSVSNHTVWHMLAWYRKRPRTSQTWLFLKAELLCPTDEQSERHTEGRETETQSTENPRPSAPRAALCALLTKESTPELLRKYCAQSRWMLSNTMHTKRRHRLSLSD